MLYFILMAKFVEMDERVKFKEQIEEKGIDGRVILINKFNVSPDKVEQFLQDWGEDAINFKEQPGFISAQLHKGIGKSCVFINYAVWESLEHYKKAINKRLFSYDPQSPLLRYDGDSLVMSPHLFKKVAVPGICEE
jgi:quinol monooxygenase YgiN